ncbi:protein of unknown function [Burkholderia multivorans]
MIATAIYETQPYQFTDTKESQEY